MSANVDRPLEGQVAVVTGAGRGIGAATALALAERGAKVALAARTESEVVTISRRIAEVESVALPVKCDVTDEGQVERLFREVRERLGAVDILVNNAGNVTPAKVAETTLDQFRATIDVNVTSVFLCSREALKDMLARRRGRIVNVASVSGVSGVTKYPGFCSYSAAKSAVICFTEALGQEVGASGVRVACVSPAAVATQLLETAAPGAMASMVPEDVARVIAWLCEPDAHAVNGANLIMWGK